MTVAVKQFYPVVIVGGGMAGASLALALAQQGIESAVFEAFEPNNQSQPSFDDRTVALSAASLNILDHLGVPVQQVSEPIKTIHVSDKGHFGFARLSAEEAQVEQLGAVVENWQLGNTLHQKIELEQAIDYITPATVTKLQQDVSQATLTIEMEGDTAEVGAQLVVLADGARSPLRQMLHIESEVKDFNTSAIVCNLSTQLPHDNVAFERFTTDGPLALLPLTQKRMALVWSKPRDQIDNYLSMSEKQFAKSLEDTFGARLGRITKVGERKSFPLVQQKAETLFRGRCVIIGNAAQSLHPIAGQGFNLGLRDVSVLSHFLKNKSDYGAYEVLSEYQEMRQKDREQTLFVTESLARLFANSWAPLSLTRNLLLKFLDTSPVAKSVFAEQAMGFNFNNSELAANDK
ncbi:2-octaprenyl-6-methoxyphenyl hydroxylase [Kangiella sediminilitoris]|uniref:2-polyprenyl-6-methoxyphenol 4-hydroxylase n=1 Tax=Kangiella sediminilitoris TaxID=1144748 RepID=A0A1B3B7X3_9GAMM|nr:2-octaprenyl-6-methoxyphenyl hydroxylase [Kangiella sediminilitoris]AOE48883.1 2-polyprenyl-6-methoxyphenol 4-hydroxylase [Kangiella sediminilitoris]